MTTIDLPTTALVFVDLNKGMLRMRMFPHSGNQVLANAVSLADAFRDNEGLVVLVSGAKPSGVNSAAAPIQRDIRSLTRASQAADFRDIPDELGPKAGDHFILKHAWSAFFSTDLDIQLRRRNIRTLVLGGITSNFGVESTARDARAYGYDLIFLEDVMRALTLDEHRHSCRYTFPMMGTVSTSRTVLGALGA